MGSQPALARPGGNLTGLSVGFGEGLVGKWLELLQDMVPRLSTVAVIANPDSSMARDLAKELQAIAPARGLKLRLIEVRDPAALDRAFEQARRKAQAVMVLPDPTVFAHRWQVTALAAKHRLPAIYPTRDYVEAGGLITYGPDFAVMFRRAADYVDKILRGAKPGDLPIEQPTQYVLVVNLKTAKALGHHHPRVDSAARRRSDSMNRAGSTLVIVLFSWLMSAWVAEETHAQQPAGPRRIGVVAMGAISEEAKVFKQELRDAGYVEGRDISIDWWQGGGDYSYVSEAVADMVQRKVDVIVVAGTPAALAAKRATSTIPIVMALVADPVGSGLVASLARPGGNVTGLSAMAVELSTKRLQLLKEAIPRATRVGVIFNPDAPYNSKVISLLKVAAPGLGSS